MLYAIVALLVIIADQWLKYWVAGNIVLNTGVKELIPGVISLVNIHNEGAAFGFMSGGDARIYFIIICAVFTIAVIVALATNFISGSLGRWSAVFIMAGGIGNCIDRILYGYVQDMFKVEFFNFPIFNVADIAITVFCFVFILYILFGGEGRSARSRRLDDDDDYEDEEEEEEEVPARRRIEKEEKPVRRRRDAFDEDDDEEEDVPVRPLRRRAEKEEAPVQKQPVRKSRQPKYEQDYEQFKAARAARQQQRGEHTQQQIFPPAARRPAVCLFLLHLRAVRAEGGIVGQFRAAVPALFAHHASSFYSASIRCSTV